jgi:hypothetical protein
MKQFSDLSTGGTIESFPVQLLNENVRLSKVEYKVGTKNNPTMEYISVTFVASNNGVTNMLTENMLFPSYTFCVKDINRKDGTVYTVQDQKDTIDNIFLSRLLQIAISYGVDKTDIFSIKYDTWGELGKKYQDIVNTKMDKDISCYMKTAKNKKGYVCLPDKGRFLSNMVNGKPSFEYTDRELEIINNFNDNSGITSNVSGELNL